MSIDSFEIAQQFEKESKWAEAAEQYMRLLDDSPSKMYCERAAWCFSRAGNYIQAIKILSKLREKEPLSAKWLYMLGYQYYCKKEWHTAIDLFEKALELYPDYFVVKYRLSYAYIQTAGSFQKLAKAEYWKAIGHLRDCHRLWNQFDNNKKQKERSTYFDINFLHGKILMDLPNHYIEAIGFFTEALKLKPTDEFAKYNLSKTYYFLGEYEKAKACLPQSNQYFVIELTAYIDGKLGDYRKAIASIQSLLQKRKKDYLHCFLAEIFLLSNDRENAYKSAREALEIGKGNHKNYYVLAKIYYRFGLLNKAVENLEIAIKLKHDRYDASYIECEQLKETIQKEMPPNYFDDIELLERLIKPRVTLLKQGTVCKYVSEKGFGFIKDISSNIFFHISYCKYQNISVGDRVTYVIVNTDKGCMAINVQKLR